MTNNLGQVLKDIRKEKNMSLREFSEYLSISHTYLSKLEKSTGIDSPGDTSPTISTLSKIAGALDIELMDFMYDCGYFSEKKVLKSNQIDLKQYIKQIESDLLSIPNVMYDGELVDNTDLNMLIAGLEVGLHIILRKK